MRKRRMMKSDASALALRARTQQIAGCLDLGRPPGSDDRPHGPVRTEEHLSLTGDFGGALQAVALASAACFSAPQALEDARGGGSGGADGTWTRLGEGPGVLRRFPGPAITTTANVAAAKTANPPTSTAPGHTVRTHTRDWNPPVMSSKYAFTKSLKEVRFLFCQTSEHSAAVRYVFSCCAGTPSSSPSSSPVSPPLRPEAEAEHLSLAADARARCVVRPRAALVVNGRCTRGATGIRVQLARSERNGRRGTGTKKDKSGKLTRARSRRSFLLRAYPTMKKNNPNTPIMIREAAGTLPKIFARYEFGTEKQQSLEGLSDKQIEETVTGLVKNGTAA
ncbi:hypothetical protein Purlil1_9979 [Purpureocillium lilacinum]|uniref:Ribosomal protein/NADH dehydrogenase domain-containing protein n=1 Tax=Purpureocillium lilacinum TaxID=33203 RepID=A0ABR0BNQ9_PURLI|nr:hypothetical protein Purlil1_9979 [Purpureocillium lilacinum]